MDPRDASASKKVKQVEIYVILLAFAFYGRRTKLGLMMELDVKLAPQCMEVGSAGLHTAAAAIQCRRGCQDLDS